MSFSTRIYQNKVDTKFLKEVAKLSVTAFGGPQAHIALFLRHLVEEKKFITEEDLLELNALCQILPGPTSTQTITAIGLKLGGPITAILTLFIWALPAVTIMTTMSMTFGYFQSLDYAENILKFIAPMAIGFIVFAAIKLGKKTVKNTLGYFILGASALATIFTSSPYLFPVILIIGGLITGLTKEKKVTEIKEKIQVHWRYLMLFFGVFFIAAGLGTFFSSKPIVLFENFYRFGALIFGGGQVLIPIMFEQFVEYKQYLTSEEFLSGYGFMQMLPGPVFSFSAFTGGLSLKEMGVGGSLLGSVIGAIGIFAPGTFLILFVYPIWKYLKQFSIVNNSLEGINAAAAGMVLGAAFILFQTIEPSIINIAYLVITALILYFTKIPAPVVVMITLALGFLTYFV